MSLIVLYRVVDRHGAHSTIPSKLSPGRSTLVIGDVFAFRGFGYKVVGVEIIQDCWLEPV